MPKMGKEWGKGETDTVKMNERSIAMMVIFYLFWKILFWVSGAVLDIYYTSMHYTLLFYTLFMYTVYANEYWKILQFCSEIRFPPLFFVVCKGVVH